MYVNQKLQFRLLRKNIKCAYLDGIFFNFVQGVTLPYLGLYILRFHGPEELVNLIAAAQPVMLFAVSLLAASYVNSFERKKWINVNFGLIVRFFILMMAFIPFLSESWRAWTFFILWSLMYIPWGFGSLSWSPLICNMIPEERRGSFLGMRYSLVCASTSLGTVFAGLVLAKRPFLQGFTFLFLISFISTMVSVYFLTRMMEPVVAAPGEAKKNYKFHPQRLDFQAILRTFDHPRYGQVFSLSCLVLFIFHIGYSMAIPLYTLRQVQQLRFTNLTIVIITTVQSISALFGSYIGGCLSDRWGYRYVLLGSTMISVISPLIWSFTSGLPWLILASSIAGFSGNSYLICFFYMVLAISPYEDRSHFVGVNIASGNLAGTIGPMLGMFLIKTLAIGIQGSLIAAAILMFSGAILSLKLLKTELFN